MSRRTYAYLAAVAVTTTVAVRAFNPQPDPPKVFGMLGMTMAETARLNVVVPITATPGCRVAFGFLNADGTVVKQEVKAIAAGHGASLELTGAEAFLPPGPIRPLRADIRPVVELAPVQVSTTP